MAPEKGSYRSVYSAIWENPEFQEFDPITQVVFFCLRTSRDCNFPCIFPHYHSSLYERIAKATPGQINQGIEDLLGAGWIRYERPVLWIVKGLRNDPNYVPANTKQRLGILNILKTLPKLKIVAEFASYYGFDLKEIYPTHAGIHEGTDTRSRGASKQGKGKGKGKEKKDLTPVDNSTPVDKSNGPDGAGGVLGAPPAPGPGNMDTEIIKLGKQIEQKRKELGISKP